MLRRLISAEQSFARFVVKLVCATGLVIMMAPGLLHTEVIIHVFGIHDEATREKLRSKLGLFSFICVVCVFTLGLPFLAL
jgi:hypothetical protein